ncbi:EI24 domain-containing protein [Actibacterium ureilyticum]|uniref:EI24 domain-containing protein n=1 Tax=Actibacterium ureilyticum TaxID=1590614 RepID=UPI000BAA9EC0|nr:EI24 domain-containing protein [Actibacterium ureilyticum]
MIFDAFLKSLGQLGDPRFQSVLWKGIGLTVALLVAVTWGFVTLIGWFVPDTLTIPWVGEIGWTDNVLSFAAVGLMMVLSVFLMVPVASAFTGIFLDDVAEAVEDRHYPGLPPAPRLGFGAMITDSLAFLGVLLLANLLMLLIYLISGPLVPLLFWAVNGFLLGREYFQMAAMRRLGRAGAVALRKRHFGTIWLAGILMAIPLSVPLVNLLVPILGAATFTHLVQRLQARDPSGQRSPDPAR